MTWPLNGSEAGGDLVLIKTGLLLFVVLKLTSGHLNEESREVCLSSLMLAYITLLTKHTTVKWLNCTVTYLIQLSQFQAICQ